MAATCASNFKKSEAATAFLDYLTTPDAAEIWVKRGGFSSPNKNVDESVYPDDDHAGQRDRARQCGGVPVRHVRPAAVRVRRNSGAGLFKAFTDFVAKPDDIDGITQQMETDAKKAFNS